MLKSDFHCHALAMHFIFSYLCSPDFSQKPPSFLEQESPPFTHPLVLCLSFIVEFQSGPTRIEGLTVELFRSCLLSSYIDFLGEDILFPFLST